MNRPSLIYASAEMALDAEDVRKNRTEGAPALVTAGKPSAEKAAPRQRISSAIGIDCKVDARREPQLLDRTTDPERTVA